MAMKPRTFRRVVLLGSLGAIVLLVVMGYFVVRPWQNQRQLEALRTDGSTAYEQSDFVAAQLKLGRYIRAVDQPEPESLLMHARARAKVQAADGGHILSAINSYREYLRRVPGDTEAKKELLPLMNTWGMYVEARSLAEDLINKQGVTDIDVIRELRLALRMQQVRNEELEPVILAAYEHEDSGFSDAGFYYKYLEDNDREAELDELIAERVAKYPDRSETRLFLIMHDSGESSNEVILSELTSIVGFDPESSTWAEDAPVLSPGAAWYVSLILNQFQLRELSTQVLVRTATNNQDFRSTVWAARRLYWMNDQEALKSLEITTPDGEPDPDVLGYQYLAALRVSDEQTQQEIVNQLDSVVLDRRAGAWKMFIAAESAFRSGELIDARFELQNALEIYPSEPTFRLLMGDIHQGQGRFNEAVEQWTMASEIANDQIGSADLFESSGWTTPIIRIVNAYSGQSRLVEAFRYIDELERIGQYDNTAALSVLRAKATLARSGELPREMGLMFAENWEENKDQIEQEARAQIAPMVATILATMDRKAEARAELELVLSIAQEQPSLLADLVDVDARYGLGVAENSEIDLESIGVQSPVGALRIANRLAQQNGSTDAGLGVIDAAMAEASQEDRGAFERIRVQYLDAQNDPRATEAWDELLDENPSDIELLYLAAESKAFSQDIARVDALISKITELTSTAGKTPPSRLRLARANALVGETRNRTSRDRALEIVRSVVASEPNNIKARNMLGRLLSLPPSPGLEGNEQYERDFQGAIEQYLTLARQLNNYGAITYFLAAADLAFEMGDEEQNVSLLRELTTRFSQDWAALSLAAERFENIGRLEEAADLYRRVLAATGKANDALAYADLLLRQGNASEGMRLLEQIGSPERLEHAPLGADQILRLAGLYNRAGEKARGESIASDGERFGLSPAESKVLLARYARSHLTPEVQLQALRDAVAIDPSYTPGWKLLIKRLTELQRFEEAAEAYTQAVESVAEDDELARLGVLAQGAMQTADQIMSLPGMKDTPLKRAAVERVMAYDDLPGDAALEQRVRMLSSMIDDFSEIEAVQSFAVFNLAELFVQENLNPQIIARYADRALKNDKSNTAIMAIAGEMYLRVNDPQQAIRVVELWRANSLESSIAAEAITARAMLLLEQYQQAADLLAPRIPDVIQAQDVPVNREMLDVYCSARLNIGENPAVTAARLEPLIAVNREVRNQTWLGLASNVINDPAVGASWIEQAEEYMDEANPADRLAMGRAWVQLAENHRIWDSAYALKAIRYVEPLIDEAGDTDMAEFRVLASAYTILARSAQDPDSGSSDYATAVDYLMRVSESDPVNLAPLLDAASLTIESGMHARAKVIYEQILAYDLTEGPFKALVLNNLAMSAVRAGVSDLSDQERDKILDYAKSATELEPTISNYWGTRGWVELEFGELPGSERSFRTMTSLSPDAAEGWAGMAIVLFAQGEQRADEASVAIRRLRQIDAQRPLEEEVRSLLSKHGLEDWATIPLP